MASVGGSLGWLRSFDVYRKVERDFTKQTRTGAALSLLALLFTLGLFATELASFLTVTVETDMDVDATSHVATFDALFSITLPNMPCAAVSLDVEDTMGRHEVGVESMLRKRRYTRNGTQLSMHDPGAHGGDIEQQLAAQAGEHCNVHGHLALNKVPGNFHLSSHRFGDLVGKGANFAHVVDHLSFGEILGEDTEVAARLDGPTFHPLNGRSANAHDDNVLYEYYLRIVPTIFEAISGERRTTFQFTYAYKEHHDEHKGHAHPPVPSALFFRYELSPIAVVHRETRPPLFRLLVNLCAITGGVFAFLGLVDSLVFRGAEVLKKREMGKLG